jgi:phosphatidylserine/phosphatidylglycerophosphate/cardiolipin synthase-like enzyme
MVVDGKRLFSGSYNLSDNAEHDTFENMMLFEGETYSALVASFEQNFESIWKTGRDENKLAALTTKVESSPSIPLVFDPMALTWAEVSALKSKIRSNCTAADSAPFRENPGAHMSCTR